MDDIIKVAWIIHNDGFTAVDPSPLNAQVSGLYIKGGRPSGPTINEVNRICLIIGNTHENAIKHIERARRGSIKAIGIKDSGG